MSTDPKKERLIQNEELLRDKNTAVAKGIKKYYGDAEVKDEPIAFVCECSNLTCDERIIAPINMYQRLHERKDRFMVVPCHDRPPVENVVKDHGHFTVVEKYALEP